MKKTGIMTDSHSGILENEASKLGLPYCQCLFILMKNYIVKGWIFPERNFMKCFVKVRMWQHPSPSPGECDAYVVSHAAGI